jgi:hypothetical protein
MTGIEAWSTTAASNNSAVPNGWPEGMAPSGVNDAARQMMASIRTWYETAQWINLGYTHTYVGASQFKISGSDVTAIYTVGRRVRAVGSSTGTIYGIITVSAFVTDTTLTVAWDSGSLSNETLTVSLGIITPASSALPPYNDAQPVVAGSADPTKKIRFEVDGLTTATTRVITVPDTNLSLVDYYETGSWTPADGSGAALTFGTAAGRYTRIGRMVFAYGEVTYPVTVNGAGASISGLPFTCLNANYARQGFVSFTDEATLSKIIPTNNTTTTVLFTTAGAQLLNSALSSDRAYFFLSYPVT